jgi:hypothetical protein
LAPTHRAAAHRSAPLALASHGRGKVNTVLLVCDRTDQRVRAVRLSHWFSTDESCG